MFSSWNQQQRKVPGSARQVRGAAFPPVHSASEAKKVEDELLSNGINGGGGWQENQPGIWTPEKQSPGVPQNKNYNNNNNSNNNNTSPNSVPHNTFNNFSHLYPNLALSASSLSFSLSSSSPSPSNTNTNVTSTSSSSTTSSASISAPPVTESNNQKNSGDMQSKRKKFSLLLEAPDVNLEELRKISWSGIPPEHRMISWQLLLGYLPGNVERREATLTRKREEYKNHCSVYFDVEESARTEYEQKIFKQISIDVPRTNPTMSLFQSPIIQGCLQRVLYLWAIRHPASGYVQGINDLATPFLIVFLLHYAKTDNIESLNPEKFPKDLVDIVEADSYWCLSNLLDGIQDNYTFAQPGIQKMVYKLKELVHRIDEQLYNHLMQQDAQFIQFSFRWMNCLLMRELPLQIIIRMWDTYLSEPDGFADFHVYVCVAFLTHFSAKLRQMEFQEMMFFLQHPPTVAWDNQQVELVLSQAYLFQTLYKNAPKHLQHAGGDL